MTDEQYRELVNSNEACLRGIAEIKRLLNGNPDEDVPGIRPRVTRLEQKFDGLPYDLAGQFKILQIRVDTLTTEWQALQQRYMGAKWVLGVLGVTNLVTLAALARFLWGLG